jgi:hypothetical protein
LSFFESIGGSGKTILRGFCPMCGAQVVGDVGVVPSLISIRAGTLNDPSIFRPAFNAFATNAQAWDAMDESLPKFEKLPPRSGA